MRSIAEIVGVLKLVTVMPYSALYQAVRCARSQSFTSTQMIGVPAPLGGNSSPRLWKPTR